MYILLAEGQTGAELEEPEDCMRFHVVLRDIGIYAAQGMLQADDVGRLEDSNTAWINVAAVRKLAEGQVGPDWSERFQQMVDYAASKGWVSEDGADLQAHIERE